VSAFEAFLSTPAMLATFGEPAIVQAMLDFEAALARAEAAESVIPAAAAETIAAQCQAGRFDVPALIQAAGRAGSLAIPLVGELRRQVAEVDAGAERWVHWGSTSQDVIDSAMALATRRALALVQTDLARLTHALLSLAEREADTPMLARTLMQPASATTLGFKIAGWVAPLLRARERLARAADAALQLQLGGAVGTLAVLGERGPAVVTRLAALLDLRAPAAAWHTQRDAWVALGCEVALLVGSLGKIARDLALLSQGEVGELSEPSEPGRGGSTAMPHKRNPVASMVALAAAQRTPQRAAALLAAMVQEHERGLGNWQAELAEWAGLWISAGGAVAALADAAPGLVVDRQCMRNHLDAHRADFDSEAALRAARQCTAAWLQILRQQATP
jgi:3-carboxy-cis,cis-muconate cycloisomerase